MPDLIDRFNQRVKSEGGILLDDDEIDASVTFGISLANHPDECIIEFGGDVTYRIQVNLGAAYGLAVDYFGSAEKLEKFLDELDEEQRRNEEFARMSPEQQDAYFKALANEPTTDRDNPQRKADG